MLPAVPRPAARRARRERAVARDPRPPARAGRRARRARSATTSARRSTGWPRRRTAATRSLADLARRGPLPLLRRAGDRGRRERGLRGGGAPPRGARGGPGAPRTATTRIAALVACPQPLAPMLSPRVCARAEPAAAPRAARDDGPPLLPRAHARGLRRARPSTAAARSPRATATRGGAGTSRRAFVDAGRAAGGVARLRRAGRQSLPAGELAVADFYAESTASRRTARSSRSGSRGAARRHRAAAEPCTASSSPSPSPARGRGMSAMTSFTFRPSAGGLVEDEVLRGLHPDDVAPPAALRGSPEFALDRLPSPPRTSTCSTASRARTRRTSGCSRSPRCAT